MSEVSGMAGSAFREFSGHFPLNQLDGSHLAPLVGLDDLAGTEF